MKTIIISILLLLTIPTTAQITVYGRNSCVFTANLRSELDNEKVAYTYCNIDTALCLSQLFSVAIEFNLAVNGQVNLPVVLVVVGGKRYGYVRPYIKTILRITDVSEPRIFPDVYPNPATGMIHVNGEAEIYDFTGILLIKSWNNEVDVSGLVPGLYIVRNNGKTIKLIKK